MTHDADVLVLGAGPAGAAAAALLAGAGRAVDVVERARFPRFMMGESLLPHALGVLRAAGLGEAVEARGYMPKHGALFVHGERTFDLDFADQWIGGVDAFAWQVPRDDFDTTLADAAAARGARFHFEHAVEAMEVDADGVRLEARGPDGPHAFRGRFVLDATGSAGAVARHLGLQVPSDLPERMALFTHVTDGPRPAGRDEGKIWICTVAEAVWMWVIPFVGGRTSIGVVGRPEDLDRLAPDAEGRLRAAIASSPRLRERLGGAVPLFAPRELRGYSAHVSRLSGPGYALIGNAAGFLDPIFSSGVTLGLESAALATGLLRRQLAGEAVDWPTAYDAEIRSGFAVFRACVDAWYEGVLPSLIYAPRVDPDVKRQLTSVLSGYVWDSRNPLVRRPRRLWTLAERLA
jgi:flavin-dependent dehydrogenase